MLKIQLGKEKTTEKETMPSWTHRRRLIYFGFFTGVGMIIFAAVTFFTDTGVSNQMVVGGVSLISIVLTAYTAMATYEDVKLWKNEDYNEEQLTD
jgi:cadmium resistance protein CadD (predicted permease)